MGAVCQSHVRTIPAYAMVLARGHGLLTKQVYLSGFSSLQSAEFPCCFLALENINWPTAANWITMSYIVVVNRCLTECRCLTKKTPGIRCLSYIQTYTHQRKCHIPLSNSRVFTQWFTHTKTKHEAYGHDLLFL